MISITIAFYIFNVALFDSFFVLCAFSYGDMVPTSPIGKIVGAICRYYTCVAIHSLDRMVIYHLVALLKSCPVQFRGNIIFPALCLLFHFPFCRCPQNVPSQINGTLLPSFFSLRRLSFPLQVEFYRPEIRSTVFRNGNDTVTYSCCKSGLLDFTLENKRVLKDLVGVKPVGGKHCSNPSYYPYS